MTDDERDNPGIVVPPPLIYLGPLVLGLLLNRQLPDPFLPRRMARILGLSLLRGWALLGGWFFRTMHDAGAPIRTDKPVPRLATDGPFRYTRNPGYLSLAMFYAGIASLANALWAILLLPVTLFVIEREERYLERKFDEEYLRYKVWGRRWI
jgi:protein-S-isoprenylcysteine O-methyltransferase Ste14